MTSLEPLEWACLEIVNDLEYCMRRLRFLNPTEKRWIETSHGVQLSGVPHAIIDAELFRLPGDVHRRLFIAGVEPLDQTKAALKKLVELHGFLRPTHGCNFNGNWSWNRPDGKWIQVVLDHLKIDDRPNPMIFKRPGQRPLRIPIKKKPDEPVFRIHLLDSITEEPHQRDNEFYRGGFTGDGFYSITKPGIDALASKPGETTGTLPGNATPAIARENTFVPSPNQLAILNALDGKLLGIHAFGKIIKDRRQFYRDVKKLRGCGLVEHIVKKGYYRTDAPPPDLERFKSRREG